MSVSHKMYGRFFRNIFRGDIPNLSDGSTIIKVALLYKNAFDEVFYFDQNMDNWGQIKEYECTDDDYVDQGGEGLGVGGQILLNKTVTYTPNITLFDTTTSPKEIVFTEMGNIKAIAAVFYYEGLTDADSKLLTCIHFGTERESIVGRFALTLDSNGIFKAVVPA